MAFRIVWITIGIVIHVAIFVAGGLIVIAAIESLLAHGSLTSIGDAAAHYATLIWDSIRQERRQPFVLCVMLNVVALPAILGAWTTTWSLAAQRPGDGAVALRAALAAAAGFALLSIALAAIVATAPFRIGPIANFGLAFYSLVMLVWNVLAVPFTIVSSRTADWFIRRNRKTFQRPGS